MCEPTENGDVPLRDVRVWRLGPGGPRHSVIREAVVGLVLNGRLLIRMSCVPVALDDLAIGFLASEGLIDGREAVSELGVSSDRTSVSIQAGVDPLRLVALRERLAMSSGCGSGASAVDEDLPRCSSAACFSPADLSERMNELHHGSVLFRQTGGVHASAMTDGKRLLAFSEDLGRHNAVDKSIGRCLVEKIALGGLALLTTGRLSADIIAKAIRVGLAVVVSRGAVTSRGIELAAASDVAAVGFARGREMNVYTAPWRVGLAEKPETGS